MPLRRSLRSAVVAARDAPSPAPTSIPATRSRKRSISYGEQKEDEEEEEEEQEEEHDSEESEDEEEATAKNFTPSPRKVARRVSTRTRSAAAVVTPPPSLTRSTVQRSAQDQVKLLGHTLSTVDWNGQVFVLLDDVHDALERGGGNRALEKEKLQEELEAEQVARLEAEQAKEAAEEELMEYQRQTERTAKMDDYAEALWFQLVERVFSKVKFAADKTVPAKAKEMKNLAIMPDNATHKNTFADACMDELASYSKDKDLARSDNGKKAGEDSIRRKVWLSEFKPPKSGASWCRQLSSVTLATVAMKRLSVLRASFSLRTKKIIHAHVQRLGPKARIPFLSQLIKAASKGSDAEREYAVLKEVVLSRMCVSRAKKKFKVEYESSKSHCLSHGSRQVLQGKCVGQFLTQSDEALIYVSILNFVVVDTKREKYTLDGAQYTGGGANVTDDDNDDDDYLLRSDKTARGRRKWRTSSKPKVKANEKEVPPPLHSHTNGWTAQGVQKFKSLLALVKQQRARHKKELVKEDRPTYFSWDDTQFASSLVARRAGKRGGEPNHGGTYSDDDLERSDSDSQDDDDEEEGEGEDDNEDEDVEGEEDDDYVEEEDEEEESSSSSSEDDG